MLVGFQQMFTYYNSQQGSFCPKFKIHKIFTNTNCQWPRRKQHSILANVQLPTYILNNILTKKTFLLIVKINHQSITQHFWRH